jgi:hypothetical protein
VCQRFVWPVGTVNSIRLALSSTLCVSTSHQTGALIGGCDLRRSMKGRSQEDMYYTRRPSLRLGNWVGSITYMYHSRPRRSSTMGDRMQEKHTTVVRRVLCHGSSTHVTGRDIGIGRSMPGANIVRARRECEDAEKVCGSFVPSVDCSGEKPSRWWGSGTLVGQWTRSP